MDSRKPSSESKSRYDFIVCGSGSSGSVVARRLAESPDDVPSVMNAGEWRINLGSERNWKYHDTPNPALNGRAMPLSMGKVLGGGSSINAMYWVRGNKNDWDFFASEACDLASNYESVKQIYRRIEDWQGEPNVEYRGAGAPVYVRPTEIKPVGSAVFEAMQSMAILIFASLNGSLTESDGGGSKAELINRNATLVSRIPGTRRAYQTLRSVSSGGATPYSTRLTYNWSSGKAPRSPLSGPASIRREMDGESFPLSSGRRAGASFV